MDSIDFFTLRSTLEKLSDEDLLTLRLVNVALKILATEILVIRKWGLQNIQYKPDYMALSDWYNLLLALPKKQDSVKIAVRNNQLYLVKLLNESGYPPDQADLILAADNNYLELAKYIGDFVKPKSYFFSFLKNYHIDILDWLAEEKGILPPQKFANKAIENKNREFLIWLIDHNINPTPEYIYLALKTPNLAKLIGEKFINVDFANEVARKGDIDLLENLSKIGIYPNRRAVNQATDRGDWKTLAWLWDKTKILPTEEAIFNALKYKKYDVLDWLSLKIKFNPTQEWANAAAENGNIIVLTWLAGERKLWGEVDQPIFPDQEGVNLAATQYHLDTLKWIWEKTKLLPSQVLINNLPKALFSSNDFKIVEILDWVFRLSGMHPDQNAINQAKIRIHPLIVDWSIRNVGISPEAHIIEQRINWDTLDFWD